MSSWDSGAISNFGALTFPSDSTGGGSVSPNLVVSTLSATDYVSTTTVYSAEIYSKTMYTSTLTAANSVSTVAIDTGSLIASSYLSSLSVQSPIINTSTITASTITVADNININNINSRTYLYTFGGNTDTTTLGFSTIVLPFSYSNDSYIIIAQYNSNSGYVPAVTHPIVCTPTDISSFLLHNGNTSASYPCNYITVGQLA